MIALRTQDGFPQVMGPPALCLYRIAQEALGNALRYSGASRVDVGLSRDEGYLSLTVSDLGRGFDPQGVRSKGGLGLISMEERVRLLGGDVSIESRPGDGAMLKARIPWEGEV